MAPRRTVPRTPTGSAGQLSTADGLRDAVVLSSAQLRALAHPLRIRMLVALRNDGPSTATRLAAKLGESSGATSYHLRELAKQGLVGEDPEHGDGGARERWWRALHATSQVELEAQDEERVLAGVDYLRAVASTHAARVDAWLAVQPDASPAWRTCTLLSNIPATLPPAAARALQGRIAQLVAEADRAHRTDPGARRVVVQLQIVPTALEGIIRA